MVWLSVDCEMPELRGGFGETALSRDGHEGLKVVQIDRVAFMAPPITLCRL